MINSSRSIGGLLRRRAGVVTAILPRGCSMDQPLKSCTLDCVIFLSDVCALGCGDCASHMRQPLLNLRTRLWCCAARLSQSAHALCPPVRVRLSPGYAPAPGCAASRPSISVLCAAFFRLAGLAHGRLIALKARVLIQDSVGGITERLGIGNLLVMDLPGVGLTQAPYSFGLGMHYHHILVAVGLAFAAVVQGLF